MKPNSLQLYHFACFSCRRSFKRSIGSDQDAFTKVCPRCSGTAIQLGRHFKPPSSDDRKQWQKVRFLVEHGFFFHKVRVSSSGSVPYPATLAEAEQFVVDYQSQAWVERIPEAKSVLAAARTPSSSDETAA